MSDPEPREAQDLRSGDPHRTAPPGRAAQVVVVAGWLVMAGAVVGMSRDPQLGSPRSWLTWVVGAAVLHDAVLLPLVVGAGWVLGRVVPVAWRTPWRIALVVGAVISLAVFPIARRFGAREDNPSILPLDVGRHLLILLAVLVGTALVVSLVNSVRIRRRRTLGVRT